MKKIYKLEDLDCPHCAQKMEDAINNLDCVKCASVNFLTQKLTIEADDNKFDEAVKKASKEIKKIEPDCSIAV